MPSRVQLLRMVGRSCVFCGGHRDIVEAILRRKANVGAATRACRTPPQISTLNDYIDVMVALSLYQVSIEKKASDSTTPSHNSKIW